ncbi:hypothetical protein [Aeromonas veronii]|uniref:hypothetical protein n=1 Tax=Aeromonas veronii TaxID=654 RepID=UPI003BA17430
MTIQHPKLFLEVKVSVSSSPMFTKVEIGTGGTGCSVLEVPDDQSFRLAMGAAQLRTELEELLEEMEGIDLSAYERKLLTDRVWRMMPVQAA